MAARRVAEHSVLPAQTGTVLVAVLSTNQQATEPAAAAATPACNWAAANQRKTDAVRQLAPLAGALDNIESRIAELVAGQGP